MKKYTTLLFILLSLLGFCKQNGGRMTELPELVNELTNPTGEILEIMDRGTMPPLKPEISNAITIARGWIEQLLTEACHPPEDALFIPFSGDGKNTYDVIRVHYPVKNRDIQIAQTFSIISVVVQWPLPKDKTAEEHVQEVIAFVLNDTQRLNLEFHQLNDTLLMALQKISDPPPEYMNYMDHLIVWTDNYRIGIATLKKGERPGRAIMSWKKGFNLSWFSLYKK